jgi:hypothetical protein
MGQAYMLSHKDSESPLVKEAILLNLKAHGVIRLNR